MVDEALPMAADFSALSVALCIATAHSRNPPVPLYAFITELANEINASLFSLKKFSLKAKHLNGSKQVNWEADII
ncbi:hypothetical protein AHF37_10078 [Paragonimus kellicotti]|nr:hypothetical protein AHF37_10078 [Paragonimus kellicotti]